MDAETLTDDLAALGVPLPTVRMGDTLGYMWASVTREEPNGQTTSLSVRVPIDATPLDVQIAAARLKAHIQDE